MLELLLLLVEQSFALGDNLFKFSVLVDQSLLIDLIDAEHPQELQLHRQRNVDRRQLLCLRCDCVVERDVMELLLLAAYIWEFSERNVDGTPFVQK